MARRASPLLATVALIGGLLLTTGGVAAAAPATPLFTITADRMSAIPAGHKWSFNDFFPRSATIATGGTLQFTNEGFHTATLLPTSWTVAADQDANGVAAADIDDTTLNKNGTTKVLENIGSVMPVPVQGCGTAAAPCVFDGTSIVSMGAPLSADPPAPFVVTVTAPPGTYAFHCRIHSMMSGTLTVVPAGAAGTTTAASADAAATAQASQDVNDGMAAEAAASTAGQKKNPNGTTTWTVTLGTSDPAGHVAVLDMLPRKITIKPGDTVVWRPLDRQEPHTVTFPKDLDTDVAPMCEGSGGTDTPATPTVVPPTGPQDFACSGGPPEFEFGGGDGVRTVTSPSTVSDSGLVAYRTVVSGFDIPATAALSSWYVRFTGAKAGTYTYVCQIHDGMDGTIVVH